ncbi:hypothetical protein ACFC60_32270 [Kitasatospora purpeofusca]|uniref:hypothetical protein n=1 Tax=Kitasatospora purpeofusca TaxID=67352 RepID=UPI0035E38FB5
MIAALITASASILIALIAYLMNHRGEIQRSSHQAQLEWVNSQPRELYGPLLVLSETNERSWKAFRAKYLPPQSERIPESRLSSPDRERWSRWVSSSFAPSAQKMRDMILEHGDLIIEDDIPDIVLEFCAHASSYDTRVVSNDTLGTEDDLLIRHPGNDFLNYVRASYRDLKNRQAILMKSR